MSYNFVLLAMVLAFVLNVSVNYVRGQKDKEGNYVSKRERGYDLLYNNLEIGLMRADILSGRN